MHGYQIFIHLYFLRPRMEGREELRNESKTGLTTGENLVG